MMPNKPVAHRPNKAIRRIQRLLAAGERGRWAAPVTGCGSSLKIVGLCSGVSKQET
jgi:hypothetical protein